MHAAGRPAQGSTAASRRPTRPGRRSRSTRLRALAAEAGLDPVFAEKFLDFIVEEVIRHHEEIASTHARSAGSQRATLP